MWTKYSVRYHEEEVILNTGLLELISISNK